MNKAMKNTNAAMMALTSATNKRPHKTDDEVNKELSRMILKFDDPETYAETTKIIKWREGLKEVSAKFKGFKARDVSAENDHKFPGARVWVYVDMELSTGNGKTDFERRFYEKTDKNISFKLKDVVTGGSDENIIPEKLHPIGTLRDIGDWRYGIYGAYNLQWNFSDSSDPQAIVVFQPEGRKMYPTRFEDFWGNKTVHAYTPGFRDNSMAQI